MPSLLKCSKYVMKHPFFVVSTLLMITVSCGNSHVSETTYDTNVDTPPIHDSVPEIPSFAQKLIECYPETIVGYENDSIVFADGSRMIFDDGIVRSDMQILEGCDIEDMARWSYNDSIRPFCDPGRNRCEALFKKMYGQSAAEVSKHLRTIDWCPTLVGQKVQITTINHVDVQLQKVSEELDKHPEFKPYLKNSGTFLWRVVAGTERLSPHSFAIAIDIGVNKSNYWKWDNPKASEADTIIYRNTMLKEIVEIFRKYGFIWGGNWYHYDSMHFEYRPELLD